MYQKIKEHERVQNFQVHKKQVFIYDENEVLWVYGKPYPAKIDAHSLTVQEGCFLCASSVVSKTYYAFDETLQEYDKGVFPHTLEKNHIIAFDYDSTSKYYHLEWYDLVKRKTIQRIQQPIPIHSLILQHAGFLIYFDIKNRILYGLEIQTSNIIWQNTLPISFKPILYAHQNQLIIQVQNECTAVNIETGTVIWRKTYAYLGTTRLNAPTQSLISIGQWANQTYWTEIAYLTGDVLRQGILADFDANHLQFNGSFTIQDQAIYLTAPYPDTLGAIAVLDYAHLHLRWWTPLLSINDIPLLTAEIVKTLQTDVYQYARPLSFISAPIVVQNRLYVLDSGSTLTIYEKIKGMKKRKKTESGLKPIVAEPMRVVDNDGKKDLRPAFVAEQIRAVDKDDLAF